jgi:hypothetical protein
MARLETLTEIEEREWRVKETARVYEQLTGEVARLRRQVENLEKNLAQVDTLSGGTEALQQIQELCSVLPKELTTTGFSRVIGGGLVARDVIQMVAVDAMNGLATRRAKFETQLTEAKAKHAAAEQALAKFVAENEKE